VEKTPFRITLHQLEPRGGCTYVRTSSYVYVASGCPRLKLCIILFQTAILQMCSSSIFSRC